MLSSKARGGRRRRSACAVISIAPPRARQSTMSFALRPDLRLGPTLRELWALAWPIAAAMAGETVMGLVDTKLVGGLGPAALGGVGVALTLAFLGYMTIFGLLRGVKVCVAHAVGEGKAYLAPRYAEAGALLGFALGLAFMACTRDAGPLLRLIGIDASMVESGRV